MNDPAKRMSAGRRVVLTLRRSSPLVGVLLLACACATPIGVTHVDTQSMYRSLTSSVLSADRPSPYSEQLLTRLGLGERFDTIRSWSWRRSGARGGIEPRVPLRRCPSCPSITR